MQSSNSQLLLLTKKVIGKALHRSQGFRLKVPFNTNLLTFVLPSKCAASFSLHIKTTTKKNRSFRERAFMKNKAFWDPLFSPSNTRCCFFVTHADQTSDKFKLLHGKICKCMKPTIIQGKYCYKLLPIVLVLTDNFKLG